MNRALYRLMLHLYPASFRRRYGASLLEAFEVQFRARRHGLVRFWLFQLRDLMQSVVREYADAWRRRTSPRLSLREHLMSMMTHDVRFALRALRRKPGYTVVVVLTLGLGIGLNTAIFSIVNAVLLQPLPYPDAERLVWGFGSFSGSPQAAVSPPDFLDYRDRATAFDVLAARRGVGTVALTGLDEPRQLAGQQVSSGFFEALGTLPVLGRTFTRADETEASDNVIVLSHAFWSQTLAADPQAIGRTMTLDGEPYEVVGIMPPGFRLFSTVDFWMPIAFDARWNQVRRFHNLRLVGRLAPGFTLEQARADVDVIAKQLEEAYPASNETWRLELQPLHQTAVGFLRPAFTILAGAVGLVLLIACVNVANLTLSRGAARSTELAVRTALGAGRARLMRQLLTESMVLAGAGGSLGIVLAVAGVWALRAFEPGNLPRLEQVGLDIPTLGFALGVSMLTGVLFGLVPALTASRFDVQSALKAGGRSEAPSGGRVRGALVAVEVALSLVLLVGAALLLQSFWRLNSVQPGFDPDGLVIASVSLPDARYAESDQRALFATETAARLLAMPGVTGVGITNILPLTGRGNDTYLAVPGRHQLGTDTQFNAQTRIASPGFFSVMGIPHLRGRLFTDADRMGSAPVAIINEPFVDQIFPDEDPVGRRLLIDFGEPYEVEIVGVVGGVNSFGLGSQRPVAFYLPFAQRPSGYQEYVIRTAAGDGAITSQVARVVAAVDPLQPVTRTATYTAVLGQSLAQPRFQMMLLVLFAGVALALSALGIYGVMAYYVSQRRREVGVRVALGATPGNVYRLVVGRGMALAGLGLLVGMAGAFGMTRFMSSLLFGVTARDPVSFAVMPLVLVLTALLASYLPARRAAGIDPVRVLRE